MSEKKESHWVKCLATHGNIRGIGLQATELVQHLGNLHDLQGEVLQAMGEAVISALTLAAYCKEGERVNLNIRSTGVISQALVDAYPNGNVRGYVVERPPLPPEESDVGDADIIIETTGPWGTGLLSVLRSKGQAAQQPYIGTVPLVTGFLPKDMTYYWVQSEQIPSSVGIVVRVEGKKVLAAGGFLVQVMPGATSQEIASIESAISNLGSLTEQFMKGEDPLKPLSLIFQDQVFVVMEERALQHHCECTLERVEKAIRLLGVKEMQSLQSEERVPEVRCDFCTKEYVLTKQRLQELIDELESG